MGLLPFVSCPSSAPTSKSISWTRTVTALASGEWWEERHFAGARQLDVHRRGPLVDGGTERHGNSIFIYAIGDLCIAHLGHLHHRLTKDHLDELGRIDVLMTGAGMSTGGTVDSIDEAAWDRTFDVNVKGTFLWIHYAIQHMIAAKSGAIITIGSQLAQSSPGKNAAYVASKGAIASFTKTMAVDHAKQGIRVNALMPGVIDTPMPARSLKRYADPDKMRAYWKERHPMGRIGQPEEVAKAALFLACDDSSFVTGHLLFVDGGWTAH